MVKNITKNKVRVSVSEVIESQNLLLQMPNLKTPLTGHFNIKKGGLTGNRSTDRMTFSGEKETKQIILGGNS